MNFGNKVKLFKYIIKTNTTKIETNTFPQRPKELSKYKIKPTLAKGF